MNQPPHVPNTKAPPPAPGSASQCTPGLVAPERGKRRACFAAHSWSPGPPRSAHPRPPPHLAPARRGRAHVPIKKHPNQQQQHRPSGGAGHKKKKKKRRCRFRSRQVTRPVVRPARGGRRRSRRRAPRPPPSGASQGEPSGQTPPPPLASRGPPPLEHPARPPLVLYPPSPPADTGSTPHRPANANGSPPPLPDRG